MDDNANRSCFSACNQLPLTQCLLLLLLLQTALMATRCYKQIDLLESRRHPVGEVVVPPCVPSCQRRRLPTPSTMMTSWYQVHLIRSTTSSRKKLGNVRARPFFYSLRKSRASRLQAVCFKQEVNDQLSVCNNRFVSLVDETLLSLLHFGVSFRSARVSFQISRWILLTHVSCCHHANQKYAVLIYAADLQTQTNS